MTVCTPWITASDVEECGPCSTASLGDEALERGIDFASEVLYELSGRRWPGICETTVRPCARNSCGRPRRAGGCRCSCVGLSSVTLGAYPIVDIIEVVVDGITLPESSYIVHDKRRLVRVDDGDEDQWPSCQDLSLASTEDGTWQVTFTYGAEPPRGGQVAAAVFACEIAKACNGDTCKLPAKTRSAVRQGTTVEFIDVTSFIENGRTGLELVDQWLVAVNPHGRRRRARISSPDICPPIAIVSDPGGS